MVDNNSSDDTVQIIEDEFPQVNLIKSRENLGYSGGVNLGVENATQDYVVILNPDTRVESEFLDKLIDPLKSNQQLVTIPKTLLYDGSSINTCGNIEHFTGLTFTRCLGQSRHCHNHEEIVGGLSGVCFAIKKEDFHRIGGFDENFFVYMEDAELSWKLAINNYRILYVPDSIIYHDYNLEVTPQKIYYLEIGRYLILKKYFTKKTLMAFLPSIIMSEVLTIGYSILKGREGIKYKYRAFKDAWKRDVKRLEYDFCHLFPNLSWKIPRHQLRYSFIDHTLRKFANLIFFLNFTLVTNLVLFRNDSPSEGFSNKGK